MSYITMVIIALIVLVATYVVGEWLAEGRVLPSLGEHKEHPHDRVCQDRQQDAQR